jgi:forkhead box protein N
MGTRSVKKCKGELERGQDKVTVSDQFRPRKGSANTAEKMLNVVLSVRNKRYNGEDSHKPPLSFACMIFMSLESSPTKTLPVKQIYEWIQWKFPYYRTASPGWKNSIRHNLSLNKCFKKVEKVSKRNKSVITKGGLWTVDSMYRDSLLTALKLNPYHPYHKYFTPPYFPKSMIGALREELELAITDKGLDAAERDAALSICLISGAENGGVDPAIIRAIYNDHCYTQLPTPPSSPTISRSVMLYHLGILINGIGVVLILMKCWPQLR